MKTIAMNTKDGALGGIITAMLLALRKKDTTPALCIMMHKNKKELVLMIDENSDDPQHSEKGIVGFPIGAALEAMQKDEVDDLFRAALTEAFKDLAGPVSIVATSTKTEEAMS